MRISIVSGVHIRRAQHLNQLFFELPATQGNPLPFIFFVFFFFLSSNFHIEQTLTNGSTSADGCPYLCRTSLKSTYDVCWTRNMKEEKSKTKMKQTDCNVTNGIKKKISWFRGENAPVRRRKKLNNMHSTKSKQSDCRGWLRRWMTGKKKVKPRNLSTKKKKKSQ